MSEWITDRHPTVKEVPDNVKVDVTYASGHLSREKGRYIRDYMFCEYHYPQNVIAWMPAPKPYVPPKRKRFIAWCDSVVDSDGNEHQWIHTKVLVERMPGDPDIDELIEAASQASELLIAIGQRPGHVPISVARTTFSRHGKRLRKALRAKDESSEIE